MSVEGNQNSRVVKLIKFKWYIPKKYWDKLLEGKNFKFGSAIYEDIPNKVNTKVITLYIIKKFLKQALQWILESHKKINMPFLLPNGKSRLSSKMINSLTKKELSRYNLILDTDMILYKEGLVFRQKQKLSVSNLKKEDIPFKEAKDKVDSIINNIRTTKKHKKSKEDWIY